MKNLQIEEEKPWKNHCIKEIRRLKKKSREEAGIKQVNGLKSFKVDLKVDEAPAEGRTGQQQELLGGRAGERVLGGDVLDLRNNGLYPGKKGLMKSRELEGQQQPRMVICPARPPPETPYLPAPQAPYSPDPSASPRNRLGETAGVNSEIKAIQQTRRLLANARERTRVHTISAAFEALRKQVPCYSYGQKLSKLAILRIACNYILSLARLADLDYSVDHSNLSFPECVEQCTRTLQSEGRSKKRKE
ncbi:hypothetical protein XENTR_v10000256 [Xenopus tropicalis]|uniref:Protein atonal homolog 8 n=1 Tax=Xenopus tropicalis TaxID=8364 RepID=A0A6I8S0C7_XENTR|nr:protein atonal homolog 8 [Xenopus tropicalis]KAE8628859.1 hypothetical protein XENTR_v10000256 [Xenopus tropicalis]|eukprot:XP_002937330.2 PREDICTED: protein atonal homolog 8 [Xenopus tropicalis]